MENKIQIFFEKNTIENSIYDWSIIIGNYRSDEVSLDEYGIFNMDEPLAEEALN